LKRSREFSTENNDINNEDGDMESAESLLTGRREMVLPGIDIRCFFLSEEKDQLYHYIDTRCEMMLKAGLFQEISQLLINKALTPEALVARAIGYR
jgi:tRNA A37 N6-isopentenylltransferase MiaA